MHRRPYYRSHRKRPLDFILPFLIIICTGVVIILAYQLYATLTEEEAEDKIYTYIIEGKAKFLPWGTDDWQNVYDGMNLLPGDALRTSKEGRVVLEFFNGSKVRVAQNSEFIIQEIHKDELSDNILIVLNSGEIWINEKAEIGKETHFTVESRNLRTKSIGTIFDVKDDSVEEVRVMRGQVEVDIIAYEEGEEVAVETLDIGIGQEVSLDAKRIQNFRERKSLNILEAISDEFEDSNWYKWNMDEDLDPSNYNPENLGAEIDEKVSVKPMEAPEKLTQKAGDEFEDRDPPAQPVITGPGPDMRTVAVGPVVISGTASKDTEKIVVEATFGGKVDKYTLSKYTAGSGDWAYSVSEQYGNLKPGKNEYAVYAVDKALNHSEPARIIITLEKPFQENLGEFVGPIAVSFNGSLSNEVTSSPILVKGTVSGAVSVTVNDYTLSKFKPGDKEWIYFANEEHGNMKPGVNDYEVYAVDANGKKSEVSTFQIIYKKPGYEMVEPLTPEAQ